ncbi:excisionase [Ruthenibacterium lactatiformans]|uniref:excisionase n=1 Tax=Ruthenibacterium lactatiformans TaxID=1550024 RepID=UPI001966E776|nr:excisionase [Ruthenibacterium lactatiformans]MBN3007878.1 excisionase [Ruthenibacterium lactatiformans]
MAGQREIPVWEKYTLTIEEAARYFRIGENKLRRLVDETPGVDWVLMNGNRVQIKRRLFERYIDSTDAI